MARWQPNAQERLVKAALELYAERGFDETAAADIAARADLTERTFFRYFADKREVLFSGSAELLATVLAHVASAPAKQRPLAVVTAAYAATSEMFQKRRSFAKVRSAVIEANAALQERELIKMTSFAAAIAVALRERSVPAAAAVLTGEMGTTIFKLAFERWVKGSEKKDLAFHIAAVRDEMVAVTDFRHTPLRQT